LVVRNQSSRRRQKYEAKSKKIKSFHLYHIRLTRWKNDFLKNYWEGGLTTEESSYQRKKKKRSVSYKAKGNHT